MHKELLGWWAGSGRRGRGNYCCCSDLLDAYLQSLLPVNANALGECVVFLFLSCVMCVCFCTVCCFTLHYPCPVVVLVVAVIGVPC